MVEYKNNKNTGSVQSLFYYINSLTGNVDYGFSLPFLNLGILGIKFSGTATVLLQYNLEDILGVFTLTEFLSIIR